jgi:hypothetical protein
MTSAGGEGTSAAELERWVREELQLSDAARVEISQAPGTDARCSDIVTVVEIASPPESPYSFHIEQALPELTRMDLVAALAFGGGH